MIPTTINPEELHRVFTGLQSLTRPPQLAWFTTGLASCEPRALDVFSLLTGAPPLRSFTYRGHVALAVPASMLRPGDRVWSGRTQSGAPWGRLARVRRVAFDGRHVTVETSTPHRLHWAAPVWRSAGLVRQASPRLRLIRGGGTGGVPAGCLRVVL